MPQITGALSINNGAASAKSFQPERVAPEWSTFTERTSTVSAGYPRLGIGLSPASAKRPTNRVDVSFDLPILQVVNGINSVAYTGRFKGYFVIPDTMTALERADLHAYVANGLANTVIRAIIKDLDPTY